MNLPRVLVRKRRSVAVLWLAAAALLLPQAERAAERLQVAAQIPGSESAEVTSILRSRFASPFAESVVLVVTGLPRPDTPAGRGPLAEVVAALERAPGVSGTASYLDQESPSFLAAGAEGGTFVVAGLEPQGRPVETLIPGLRAMAREEAARLRPRFPAVALRLTGESVLNVDLRRTSAEDSGRAEGRALPLTLSLLLLAFGALVAALLAVVSGFLAISLAMGAAALVAQLTPLSLSLQSIVSMLGLGLGIDYALLMVSRFREACRRGAPAQEAAEHALRHAGHTIVVSALAVAVGFLALLLVPVGEVRSLAVGGLLVVAVSVLLATTLLPGVLAWLGPRVDRGRLALRVLDDEASFRRWRSWSAWVAARPVLTLLLAGLPVLFLALQARRLHTGLPEGNWLPPGMESARAVSDLQAMGRSGVLQAVRVVLELPEEAPALSREGWQATRRLRAVLGADPRVAEVRSLPDLAGARADELAYVSLFPSRVKRVFVSDEGDAALLELVPRENVQPDALVALVRELRGRPAVGLTGLPGTRLWVGGLPAFNADYEEALEGRFWPVLALVCGGTFLALALGFRSLLIPLKAVGLNLLAVAAAFGALVLVFQDGHGIGLLGLSGPVGAVFPVMPLVVFATVFGLSMDYEVFLIARVAEARRAGHSETGALVEGLARTGGVVTSAAGVMIVVFAAFASGEFLFMKMLGFVLSVAVLLDATVVRLGLGPALLKLAGRFNWWPGDAASVREESPSGSSRGRSAHAGPVPFPAAPARAERCPPPA